MTGFKESADAWANVWTDAQKQYMDAWMGLARDSGKWPGAQATSPWGAGAPWADSMQQWSKLMSQAMPGESGNVNTRLFDLGKSYMSMGETLWRLMQQGKAMAGEACDWRDLMQNAFSGISEQANKMNSGDPWSGFATFWGLPMDTWQKLTCSFAPLPGEMGKALRADETTVSSEMNRAIHQMLSLPTVGYTREWQTQGQEWGQLMMEYNTAMQAFMQLLGKVGQHAAMLFGKKLNDLSQEDRQLDGLRAAYDLWVDCGEEAYAEAVATPEFPHLQAKMVNALMRLKRHEQTMMDEMMTAMNVPTRREIDTTHKRVYELQRQLCALQDRFDDLAESLQEQTARAEAAPASPPPAAPARKKTTSKKASAKKPAVKANRRAQTK